MVLEIRSWYDAPKPTRPSLAEAVANAARVDPGLIEPIRHRGAVERNNVLVLVAMAVGGDQHIEAGAERAADRGADGLVDEERLEFLVRIGQIPAVADAEGGCAQQRVGQRQVGNETLKIRQDRRATPARTSGSRPTRPP